MIHQCIFNCSCPLPTIFSYALRDASERFIRSIPQCYKNIGQWIILKTINNCFRESFNFKGYYNKIRWNGRNCCNDNLIFKIPRIYIKSAVNKKLQLTDSCVVLSILKAIEIESAGSISLTTILF